VVIRGEDLAFQLGSPGDQGRRLVDRGLGANGREVRNNVVSRSVEPHTGSINVSDTGLMVSLTFLGETDQRFQDRLGTSLRGGEVNDNVNVLRLNGFQPRERSMGMATSLGFNRANDGDDLVKEEGCLVEGRAGGSVDNVVCLTELLRNAETDVAGGTDDEDLDHFGYVCV